MNITLAQREALDVVKDMIDKSNTDVPEFGSKIITLILGILNVDCRVDNNITQIDGNKTIPINPDNGNGKINLDIPDWVKKMPTPPVVPEDYRPAQVWYNYEGEPIQTDAREDIIYAAEVSCTGDKTGIISVTNTADVQYNGDFRDEQISLNDK